MAKQSLEKGITINIASILNIDHKKKEKIILTKSAHWNYTINMERFLIKH